MQMEWLLHTQKQVQKIQSKDPYYGQKPKH